MFLNRQVLAPGHNTNIQTILGKDDHTYAKPWTHNQTTLLAKPFEIPNLRAKSLNSKLILVSLTQEATDRRHRVGKKMYFLFSIV
jgi:hypothetical protein